MTPPTQIRPEVRELVKKWCDLLPYTHIWNVTEMASDVQELVDRENHALREEIRLMKIVNEHP